MKAKSTALFIAENKISKISHELKTPLNSISTLLQIMINDPSYNEQQKSFLRVIYESDVILEGKINQLIDFFKIKSDEIVPKLEYSDFSSIVAALQKQFVEADKKSLKFIVEIDKNTKTIITDNANLMKALSYLLDNSIKFTKKGTITLMISQQDSNEYPVIIKLCDTGIGIAQENQDYIFEDFAQADESIAREYDGLGLGLTIAKGFVERISGKISVTSTLGGGSCFEVMLPLSINLGKKSTRKINQYEAIKDKKIDSCCLDNMPDCCGSVLLVDDDAISNFVMKSILEAKGIKFVIAENGELAIKALKNCSNVRLIITDLDMPVMNGYDLIKFVISDEKLKDLPIIVVTSSDDAKNIISLGVDAYMTKPIEVDKLFSVLDSVLG